ncbi:hypothetical protein DRE_00720 [Drechslerella stenobrocha 248]|uniref:DNA2/NAM7 helicase-like C-terminal domain-containing protein n=1 Tax=Drechslerella stenobrocha 248 TaxID=1043628 RepID=W7HMT0_9PEZI|nr:hypothetical protein DRE_00720 [Drechslerella stenobrocha 248]
MADENQAPRRGLGSNDRRRHSSSSNSHTAQYAGNFSGPDTGSRTGQDRYTNGPRHRSQSFQQPGLQQARPGLTFQSRTRFKHNNAHAGNQFRGTNNELSIAALQEFLDSGIDKIEYSEESRYAFIVQLASQSGLERVRQLLEAEYVKTYSVLKPTFEFHCVAFLRILSNDDVLKALSLEQQVRTIYNVVYGFNGERAIPFFGRVIDFLLDFKPNDDDPNCMDQESWAEALHLTSIVFLNTVKMNQSAALQSDLQTMGQQLANISQGSALVPDEVLDSARDNISRIQIILTTGADVPIERHRDDATARNGKPFRSPEEEIIDFPGKLSLSGQPRHDNDHELIDNICILPTVGEIQCDSRKDFLPTKLAYEQKSHHHQEGIQRLVDIQFRLLREDTAGQLRDAARFVIKHWSALIAPTPTPGDWSAKRKLIREGSPTPIRLYFGAQIQRLRFETKTGLEAFIEFDQPRAARRLATVKRHWYWRKSMELRENKAVVALIEKTTEDTNVIFFVVAKRNIPSVAEQSNEDSQSDLTAPVTDLSTNPWRASITLRLVTLSNALEQARLIHIALGYSSALQGQTGLLMVEFPAVIYKNFQGILTCLKHIHKNPTQLPFGKWLAPQLENSAVVGSQRTGSPVPPPAYLRHATLDLSTCFASPGEAGHTYAPLSQRLTFSMSQNPESMINAWAQGSPLDHGQAKAMVSAFSHEISLTQGPPGCGKSYVGVKMVVGLLANKASLGLGPILCICYTNHALDQFLNELLKSGVSNIARIGSPSPMAHINALAFDTYRKVHQVKIPYLSRRITATTTILEDLQREINEICVRIEAGGPMMVYNYLKKELPSKLSEIDRVVLPVNTALEDEERDGTEAFTAWINWIEPNSGPSCERTIEELIVLQAWNLTGDERLQLYLHWHQNAVDQLTQRLQSLVAGFESNKKTLTSLHLERDRMCLGQVNILGITTVGLVNNAELIRALPAKVMICEEAGEVLESHILTALIPSVEHIILIGDHLQLRPKISNRMLSKEYGRDGGKFNFDESLFERLANTRFKYPNEESQSVGIPIGQLNVQRRMHPSISNLVRTTLYPELEDHERTTIYPEVAGIRRRLFWLDHRNYEDPVDLFEAMQSKTNTWEAKMVVSLVVYLAKQGVYKPGEIAVLTPYVNQMRMFMEMFDNIVDYEISQRDLEELEVSDDEDADKSKGRQASVTKSKILDRIRIATVDNFQGEEAEIVINLYMRKLIASKIARSHEIADILAASGAKIPVDFATKRSLTSSYRVVIQQPE